MIPTWIVNTIVIVLGCIVAVFIGSALPEYGPLAGYLVGVAIVCTFCVAVNNFSLMMAFGIWCPIVMPIPLFSHFPTYALVLGWASWATFFRVCITKAIHYVPSCNLLIVLTFLWVPVRFLMSPVHKLGGGVMGGSGVSGANAYFLYALAGILVVFLGALLNSRKKVVDYMLWCMRLNIIIGITLFICAFFPATMGPILARWGMFAAGNMTDNILRLVELPGYGLYLTQAALCPALFRFTRNQSFFIFLLGLAMMIIGGNRSALTAAVIAVPMTFFLRKKINAMVVSLLVFSMGLSFLSIVLEKMDPADIPPLARSLGVFNSKIEEATGGSASANWRYEVWKSGMEKIQEAPLIGKGFGNLDKRFNWDKSNKQDATDFELVLASGESHNGFISAAYGFGIPFMLSLSIIMFWRMFRHAVSALRCPKDDLESRDMHAYLAVTIATFGVLIYSSFDMSAGSLWVIVGAGIIWDHVSRSGSPFSDSGKKISLLKIEDLESINKLA